MDGARINVLNKSDELVSYFYPNVRTLHDLFVKGQELSSESTKRYLVKYIHFVLTKTLI